MDENTIATITETIVDQLQDITSMKLPDPALLNFYRMSHDRKFWFDLQVDINALDIEREILLCNMEDRFIEPKDRVPIILYLMNYGGSADMAWSLIDVINASRTPVYTVNMGNCSSAAGLIFMAGHERYMMPNAHVLIHEGSASFGGDAGKILDASESYKMMLKRMRQYILDRTKIPQATLNKKKNSDWELDSDMCMKFEVCDHIIKTIDDII